MIKKMALLLVNGLLGASPHSKLFTQIRKRKAWLIQYLVIRSFLVVCDSLLVLTVKTEISTETDE